MRIAVMFKNEYNKTTAFEVALDEEVLKGILRFLKPCCDYCYFSYREREPEFGYYKKEGKPFEDYRFFLEADDIVEKIDRIVLGKKFFLSDKKVVRCRLYEDVGKRSFKFFDDCCKDFCYRYKGLDVYYKERIRPVEQLSLF